MTSQKRNIMVGKMRGQQARQTAVEMCEHKTAEHPDSLTDGVCEAAACALVATYKAAHGRVLHFNVNKRLLVAGASALRFGGGGSILEPIKLIICRRAAACPEHFDLRQTVVRAAEDFCARFPAAGVEALRRSKSGCSRPLVNRSTSLSLLRLRSRQRRR